MSLTDTLPINGASLYVAKEGLGEPVVFMHGFGLDHRMWKRQMAALQHSFTVISYDLRGFGYSALPDEQIPYAHEEDYLALLRHFGLERAHIVALSMGGRMALRCALTCPHAVSSLVLVDSILDGHSWSASWQNEWSNIVYAAKQNDPGTARKLWIQHSLFAYANTHVDIASELSSMVNRYSGWHWTHKDPAIVPQPLVISRLRDIALPTLVIAGELDIPDFREAADKLSQEIPHARQLIVPGVGHMSNMESPDIVNNAILEFLKEVTG